MKENFTYQSSTQNLQKSIKRTLGVHLFRIRQKEGLSAKKVCRDLTISINVLDSIEIGKDCSDWKMIQKLLAYYQKKVFIKIVSAD